MHRGLEYNNETRDLNLSYLLLTTTSCHHLRFITSPACHFMEMMVVVMTDIRLGKADFFQTAPNGHAPYSVKAPALCVMLANRQYI